MKKSIVIYGAGGLGTEVRWLIESRLLNEYIFEGYIVSDMKYSEISSEKDKIIGDEGILEHTDLCVAIGIGDTAVRLNIYDRLYNIIDHNRMPTLIDKSMVCDYKSCSFGPGTIVQAGVIATVGVNVGACSYINLNCTLGHNAIIGNGCVINPSVNVSGGVCIGDGTLIGTGSQLLEYINIGKNSTVGAGAVVTSDVDNNTTVVGIPAKPLRRK